MNGNRILTLAAILLGSAGALLLFAPRESSTALGAAASGRFDFVMQLLGSALLGFAMADWTARKSGTGGIYGRALLFGNLANFAIGALTLIRWSISGRGAA